MENHRPESFAGSAAEAGVSQRAYVQLLLLGAMVPVELATMAKWSAPAGALLLGGTVAASVTSAAGPRVWAYVRGTRGPSGSDGSRSEGRIKIRLSAATKGSTERRIRHEAIEAALRRVCIEGDSVTQIADGEFIVELQAWAEMTAEAVGRRMALAVENRLDMELTVKVEFRRSAETKPATSAVESPLREAGEEIVDGYSLRRNIFKGEPEASVSPGGEFFRRARARLQAFAPVAV